MSVPKYNELMHPALSILVSEGAMSARQLRPKVAARLRLSEEDLTEMLPSQAQPTFVNRLHWAVTYLKKARLLESPSRGVYAATERGRVALSENATEISLAYLRRFPEFIAFVGGVEAPSPEEPDAPGDDPKDSLTPQDVLGDAIGRINASLSDDLLAEIMGKSPAFFEHLVVELLVRMGYGGALDDAGHIVGKSGDEGIDGIVWEDKLGFSKIYIQAKRWEPSSTIGRPEVQKFVGALAGQGAVRGLFISTARFTKEAVAFAEKQHATRVVLVDGEKLTRLMIEYDLGVSTEHVYTVKRLDSDYFDSAD